MILIKKNDKIKTNFSVGFHNLINYFALFFKENNETRINKTITPTTLTVVYQYSKHSLITPPTAIKMLENVNTEPIV